MVKLGKLKKVNFNDKSDWANQHQWFKDYLENFTKYFKPKIRELN